MEHRGFQYIVKAELNFTDEEVKHLIELSTYRNEFKKYVEPGYGAFINAMKNTFCYHEIFGDEADWQKERDEATIALDFRELDTLLKIMESRHASDDLHKKVLQALQSIQMKSHTLNRPNEPYEPSTLTFIRYIF